MKGDDLKSMSIDELWKLHEAVTFELNQKIAAEKTQLEQRLHELQGDDDLSGPDLTTTYRAPIWRTPRQ